MSDGIICETHVRTALVPQGSKKGTIIPPKPAAQLAVLQRGGRLTPYVKDVRADDLKVFRADIRAAVAGCTPGDDPRAPIRLSARFFFLRPKSHYTSKGALTSRAPLHHTQAPDLGKLIRALEDALTGFCYVDDSQVCERGQSAKRWTSDPSEAGVWFRVEKVSGAMPDAYERGYRDGAAREHRNALDRRDGIL